MTEQAARSVSEGRHVFERRVRVVAVAAVAVAFLFALAHLSATLHWIDGNRGELASLSNADRPLIGGQSVGLDVGFFRRAARVIPRNATFAVITGDKVRVPAPATLDAVAPYAAYTLLPRVRVADPRAADWIVSYGGDLASLGLRFRRTVVVAPGLRIAEVARP